MGKLWENDSDTSKRSENQKLQNRYMISRGSCTHLHRERDISLRKPSAKSRKCTVMGTIQNPSENRNSRK